jgi:hypothetical protein
VVDHSNGISFPQDRFALCGFGVFVQRAFWAAAIVAREAALTFRFGLDSERLYSRPAAVAADFTACMAESSASACFLPRSIPFRTSFRSFRRTFRMFIRYLVWDRDSMALDPR